MRGILGDVGTFLFNMNDIERRKDMKRLLIVLLAVIALTGLMVAQGFAVDKLIVNNSGGSVAAFKVTDAGQIIMPAASGTNRDSGIQNPATVDNFGLVAFYPQSGTNVASALQIIPKGTGLSASIKSQVSILNTDYVADPVNVEALVIRAAGANGFSLNSLATGTGTVRPLLFQINTATKMTLGTNGYLTMAGGAWTDGLTWNPASSRELKENIETLSAEKAIETVKNLQPVTFVYKQKPEQGHVGFIAEDVPDLVAMNDRKSLSPLDIVAVLTKVVQEQNKTIAELSGKLNKLEAQVTRIKSRGMFGSVANSISGN